MTPLFGRYQYRILTNAEFYPLMAELQPKVVPKTLSYQSIVMLSMFERVELQKLAKNLGNHWRLNLGIYHDDEMIGWHSGEQADVQTYQMGSTMLAPDHRSLGVYSALLPEIVKLVSDKGFLVIRSKQHANNNAALIPKLKAGFSVTGLEVSDEQGIMLQVNYYMQRLRQQMYEFRTGARIPDEKLSVWLPKP
ncbi:MAG: GNAT family N-acetyltransferase [Candidatus Promineifilaceae bacterium]